MREKENHIQTKQSGGAYLEMGAAHSGAGIPTFSVVRDGNAIIKEKRRSPHWECRIREDSDAKLCSPSESARGSLAAFGLVPGMGVRSCPAISVCFFFFFNPRAPRVNLSLTLNNRKPPDGMQEAADGNRTTARVKEGLAAYGERGPSQGERW